MLPPLRTNLIKILPTVLPRNPLRRVTIGLPPDFDESFAGKFGHVGVGGGNDDVGGAVAEFVDGFVGVGGAG